MHLNKSILLLFFIIIVIGGFLIISLVKTPPEGPICKKCNVILISLDTLGSNHLPCYGYERNTAPNLCDFAKKNIYFTNSSSQSTATLPSHFSIFTGLYPFHHKMFLPIRDYLNSKITTLPQTLKSNGYETVYVGQTDDIHLPLDKGLGRGFDYIYDYQDVKRISYIYDYQNIKSWEKGYQRLIDNSKKNQPTFLFLHTYYVHILFLTGNKGSRLYTNKYYPDIPLTKEEYYNFSKDFFSFVLDSLKSRIEHDKSKSETIRKIVNIYQSLIVASDLKSAEAIFNNNMPPFESESLRMSYYIGKLYAIDDPKEVEYVKALYDEMIHNLDQELNSLFKLIDNPQIKNKTIVIITADHGEEFKEHGEWLHGPNIYNTTSGVPLIMYVPKIKQKKINDLVQGIDIFPTILNIIGIRSPQNIDGIDLSGLIMGKPDSLRNNYLVGQHFYQPLYSIRDTHWKLYLNKQNKKEPVELYNLQKDFFEYNNIAVAYPDVVNRLSKELNSIVNSPKMPTVTERPFPSWIDEEKRRKLIKEGYF
jgi:arylsulfatase A-like enzyme